MMGRLDQCLGAKLKERLKKWCVSDRSQDSTGDPRVDMLFILGRRCVEIVRFLSLEKNRISRQRAM